jgi:hypothetical protein
MAVLDHDIVHESLTLLGELLEGRRLRPLHLVVSGGSALLAAEIVSRTTHDVDVIAMRGEVDGDIIDAYPLPEFLKECVREVAEEKRLRPNWLNAATAMLMIDLRRFPADFLSELVERSYGGWLRVSYIGRSGQIYLKFYAAVARSEARDLGDLRALGPDADEAERTARWLIEEEVISKGHIPKLLDLLRQLEHHDLVPRIEALAE